MILRRYSLPFAFYSCCWKVLSTKMMTTDHDVDENGKPMKQRRCEISPVELFWDAMVIVNHRWQGLVSRSVSRSMLVESFRRHLPQQRGGATIPFSVAQRERERDAFTNCERNEIWKCGLLGAK